MKNIITWWFAFCAQSWDTPRIYYQRACHHDRPFFIVKPMKYTLKTHHRKLLIDTTTPVNMYLKVIDNFPNCILLESSDYGVNDNSVAYICFNPIADIKLQNQMLSMRYPDGKSKQIQLADNERVAKYCSDFAKQFAGNLNPKDLYPTACLALPPTMLSSILKTFNSRKKRKMFIFHKCIMLFSKT